MDQCTGQNILFLRAAGKAMQDSYLRMESYRVAATATCVFLPACPAAMEVFTLLAEAEQAIQTVVKTAWTEKEILWKTRVSCNLNLFVSRTTFPRFPFLISDALLVSPKIATEAKFLAMPFSATLSTRYKNLVSTAETKKQGVNRAWTVRWTQ
jgi:hypothetical protein